MVPPKPLSEKYRLTHTVGETISIGDPLIYHPTDDRIYTCSTVSGKIKDILLGPKNSLEAIVIEKDPHEEMPSFPKNRLKLPRNELINLLLKGGLWTCFREFPFKTIPDIETIPPAIYLSLDQDEPYMPDPMILLGGKAEPLAKGIELLQILTEGKVNVGIAKKNFRLKSVVRHLITHELEGDYPANDPGVFLYHNKKSKAENKAWTLSLPDLLRIVSFVTEGHIETHHIVSISGSVIPKPQHHKIRIGTSISNLLDYQEELDKFIPKPKNAHLPTSFRYIAGGIMTGRAIPRDGYLGSDDHGLTILEDDVPKEFLPFLKPGTHTPSHSKLFLSAILHNQKFPLTTSRHGGRRDCIKCGDCVSACPVDILPQAMMEEIQNNHMTKALKHGLLDCTECGLCSYVCPSKIELTHLFKTARAQVQNS